MLSRGFYPWQDDIRYCSRHTVFSNFQESLNRAILPIDRKNWKDNCTFLVNSNLVQPAYPNQWFHWSWRSSWPGVWLKFLRFDKYLTGSIKKVLTVKWLRRTHDTSAERTEISFRTCPLYKRIIVCSILFGSPHFALRIGLLVFKTELTSFHHTYTKKADRNQPLWFFINEWVRKFVHTYNCLIFNRPQRSLVRILDIRSYSKVSCLVHLDPSWLE